MFKFISKHLSALLVVIVLVILFVTVRFLHENFLKTYLSTHELTVSQREVTPAVFKEKLWDEVKTAIDEKQTATQIPQDIKDPFRP